MPFCHFVLELKFLYRDQSQILHDASNELLNIRKIFINSLCYDGCPGILCEVLKMTHSGSLYCGSLISDIASCIFVHNTCRSCINVTILICGGYQAISSKSKLSNASASLVLSRYSISFASNLHTCTDMGNRIYRNWKMTRIFDIRNRMTWL